MNKNNLKNQILIWQVICSILGILLILSIITKGFIGCPNITCENSKNIIVDEQVTTADQDQEFQELLSTIPRTAINIQDDVIMGSADAQVTIIEFSNFQCSACASHFSETLPEIIQNYVNTGTVKYILKPVGSLTYTEGIECANDQGKYWELHGELFENRKTLSLNDLNTYAQNIGLDINEFTTCMSSGKYVNKAQQLLSDANLAQVTATPTFFINGIRLEGTYPFSAFSKLIEAELIYNKNLE